jgi:hypothetical protein
MLELVWGRHVIRVSKRCFCLCFRADAGMVLDAPLYSHCTVGSKDLHQEWDGMHCGVFACRFGKQGRCLVDLRTAFLM